MNKISTLLILSFLLFTVPLQAQNLQPTKARIINDINPATLTFSNMQDQGKSAGTCGFDTLYYTYYKTTAFNAVALNASTSGKAFAQWFPTPQSLTVSGFDFYAWQSDRTTSVVAITCSIYQSSPDSFPQGAPIRSVTVQIDSTFRGGLLSEIRKHAKFAAPAIVTSPNGYVIVIENTTSINVSVICNNYAAATPDGRSEWLSSVKLGNDWRHSDKINVGGRIFDADFIFQPTVGYTITADFSISDCNAQMNQIVFKNTSSPIFFNRFYNRYAYYNFPQICFLWDYGDSSWTSYSVDGERYYNHLVNYDVKLKDTMYGWTKGCVDNAIRTVYAKPLPPSVSTNEPICSGTELIMTTDTFPGGNYTWKGPGNYSAKTQHVSRPKSDTSMLGEYWLKVNNHGCADSSKFILKGINQTPAKPLAYNDGSKCVTDTSHFEAFSPSPNISYNWEGPLGFKSNFTNFTFYNLDTSLAGVYSVFVEDGSCVSDTSYVNLYIYPPPQEPEIFSLSGDSLCGGDTLFLQGVSLAGAVFDWSGPDGFVSSETNPVISAPDADNSGKYFARVIIGSCVSLKDSMEITVLTPPATGPVTGSDTSTVNITKVYSSVMSAGSRLNWEVEGGVITDYYPNGDIRVQWTVIGNNNKVKVTEENIHGCFGEEQVKIVAVKEEPKPNQLLLLNDEHLSVYPNPVSEKLIIERANMSGEVLQFSLLNLHGQEMVCGIMNANESTYALPVSQLSAGVYTLRVNTTGESRTIRIVVK